MIDILDNVLEDHVSELISYELQNIYWKYDYTSEPTKPNKHWHIFCAHNIGQLNNKYSWILPIWLVAKDKYNLEDFERVYMNAHTHGIEPHLHIDDGDFTLIYYPNTFWKKEWGGGTYINGQLVEYVGNRLVIFNASLPHKAMPISRECYELRTCIVFKCFMDKSNV
jgi:hypothetical protein